jgi:hypothetical protein
VPPKITLIEVFASPRNIILRLLDNMASWREVLRQGNEDKAPSSRTHNREKQKKLVAADCEVRTHASFDNGDLSKLKTIALDPDDC